MTRNKHQVQRAEPLPRATDKPVFWISEYQRVYPLAASHQNKAARPNSAA
jgi:hypothetical protein